MGMAPLSTYKLHVKQQIAASKGARSLSKTRWRGWERKYCVSGPLAIVGIQHSYGQISPKCEEEWRVNLHHVFRIRYTDNCIRRDPLTPTRSVIMFLLSRATFEECCLYLVHIFTSPNSIFSTFTVLPMEFTLEPKPLYEHLNRATTHTYGVHSLWNLDSKILPLLNNRCISPLPPLILRTCDVIFYLWFWWALFHTFWFPP